MDVTFQMPSTSTPTELNDLFSSSCSDQASFMSDSVASTMSFGDDDDFPHCMSPPSFCSPPPMKRQKAVTLAVPPVEAAEEDMFFASSQENRKPTQKQSKAPSTVSAPPSETLETEVQKVAPATSAAPVDVPKKVPTKYVSY